MENIYCQFSTPTKTHQCSQGDMVLLPAQNGEMGVLYNHIPMIITLTKGEIRIFQSSNLVETIKINEGIAYIKEEGIEILCNDFISGISSK